MKSEIVKFAVLGCGHIGKRHAEMIARNGGSKLVALVDVRARELLGLQDYTGIPLFNSLDELFQSGIEADVICVATPNGLHAKHAIQALDKGKHVVIEKPLALSKKEAEKVLYKALKNNRHIFSVMQNRYSPPSVWLKDMVDGGLLGDIYMVQLNCFWNRDERYYKPNNWHGTAHLDGGTLFTQFSHFIDILYWVFGDIENIQSKFACNNHTHLTEFEDSGFISFNLAHGGGMGALNFSTSVWNKNMESSMTVVAQNGSIKVGGQYMNEVEYCHVKNYTMPQLEPTNPGNDYGAYKGSAANHHYIIENVVDVLNERDTITTNALEGLKVVDIIERIYAAGNRINGIKSRNFMNNVPYENYISPESFVKLQDNRYRQNFFPLQV